MRSAWTDDDGFGTPGLVLLAEQVGRTRRAHALVDTAVAARLAAGMDGVLAAEVAAGEVATALAVVEARTDWSLAGLSTSLRDGALHGEKAGVQHAATAGAFMVVADADGEHAVALVAAGAHGRPASPAADLDPAAATAVVSFDGAVADAVLSGEAARTALEQALAVGAVATAAEGLGAASAALDMAVAYAQERRQFGRPIGSFQALKHVIADAHVDREAAWSSLLYAAAAIDEGLPEAPARRPRSPKAPRRTRVATRRRGRAPGARRNRLHLGARRPPAPAARAVLRAPLRRCARRMRRAWATCSRPAPRWCRHDRPERRRPGRR